MHPGTLLVQEVNSWRVAPSCGPVGKEEVPTKWVVFGVPEISEYLR